MTSSDSTGRTPSTAPFAVNGAAALIAQSWASNGTVGFFVDEANPSGASMSLYDTDWWTHELLADSGRPSRLDANAVGRWLTPILNGDAASEALGGITGIPTLATINTAVDLAHELGIAVDAPRVAKRIDALRVGATYKSDTSDSSTSMGSTVLAVKTLKTLGLPPPSHVSANVDTQIDRAIRSRSTDDLFTVTIPVLGVMTDDQIRGARNDVRSEIGWIETNLPAMAPLQRLNAAATLDHTMSVAGLSAWPTSEVCDGLLIAEDGVRFSAGTSVEPQATAQAVDAGCLMAVAPPPWTPSGWPTVEAVTAAPQASVAGLRIADAIGDGDAYRPQLRAELTNYWLSLPLSGDGAMDTASVEMLCRLLAMPKPHIVGLDQQITSSIGASITQQSLPALISAWLGETKVQVPAGPDTSPSGSIFLAAAYALAFRVGGDRHYQDLARTMLTSLKLADGLYAATPGQVGTAPTPSVVATAIAAWINGTSLSTATLTDAGLCAPGGSPCGANGTDSPIDSQLRATAAVVAISAPDAASFPLAL